MEINETILVVNEDGEENYYIVGKLLQVEEQLYAALVTEENPNIDEATILRIEFDENDEEVLVEIEDRDEFDLVNEELDRVLVEENEDGY
jgi:uncharacterized protein YrzB (UPF0473 family)